MSCSTTRKRSRSSPSRALATSSISGSPAGGSQLAPIATARPKAGAARAGRSTTRGRLAAGAHRDGLPEGEAVAVGDFHDGRIHLLDVHVADPFWIAADDGHVGRGAVGQVR